MTTIKRATNAVIEAAQQLVDTCAAADVDALRVALDTLQDLDRAAAQAAPSEIRCNLCGLPCTVGLPGDDLHQDHTAGLLHAVAVGGYESTPGNGHGALDDMTAYHFSLCEWCLDWLFAQCRIPPLTTDERDGTPYPEPFRPAAQRVAEDTWRTMKAAFTAQYERHATYRGKKPDPTP